MKKLLFVTLFSLLLLSACSSQQKNTSVSEAIKSIEHNITEIKMSVKDHLDGIQLISFKLDNNEYMKKNETLELNISKRKYSFLVPTHQSFISQAII
jgi:uncharacterized protein YcfL